MYLDELERILREACAEAGVPFEVAPGAHGRGRPFSRLPRWLTKHHTASAAGSGDVPSLRILMYGRPGLSGPLCQWAGGRSGRQVLVATGRANHAGYGRNPDGTNPNTDSIGHEEENNGVGEPWPDAQRRASVICDAHILRWLGHPASHDLGHREVDPRRKIDPTYDMDDHRRQVDAAIAGGAPGPSPAPDLGGAAALAVYAALEVL